MSNHVTSKKRYFSNVRMPTLGGQQVWQDIYFFAGWRIQKNTLRKNCRLLNPKNIRYAGGTEDDCRTTFSRLRDSLSLENPSNHLVLMVHGMAGWRDNFFFLARALRKAGYFSGGYNYTSLFGTLEDQAEALNFFLNSLEGIDQLTFIGHSQGGMVIRKALESKSRWQRKIKINGIVLIGTPNRGAALADYSKRLKALNVLAPKVRDQLTKSYAGKLSKPNVRTGLIAGVANRGRGLNPVIKGPDDGVVGVDEVWIEGCSDRLIVSSDHFTLASRRKTVAAVMRFLEGGKVSE